MKAILRILSKFIRRCVTNKDSSKGYVLILLCFLTPVLLLGGRWVLEYANRGKIFKEMDVEKRCAREVAIAVAKNINPGLKFSDQKKTLIRIADEIYNKMPAYGEDSIPDAVPGLQSPIYEQKKAGKNYDPAVIGVKEYQSFGPEVKQVDYKAANKYVYRVAFSGNVNVGEVFRRVYFLKKNPSITDECAIIDFLPYINASGINVNTYSYSSFYRGSDTASHITMPYLATSSSTQLQDPDYMERADPNDQTVQIAIDNDRIWAKTDNDTAYAKLAECNVDIVVTVPTNMAACNRDNRDARTNPTGTPTILSNYDTRGIISSDTLANNSNVRNFRTAPIYQIAQAYHYFLQHFLHTRGANVGLVPYSGKLSLSPDRADRWTQAFPQFSWPDASQNSYANNLVGSLLYGTVGIKGTALNTTYGTWGGWNLPEKHGGYGIMMRGNLAPHGEYANNRICHGDLLDNSNPANYKFFRFNYNPCYITNVSLMTMTNTADSLQYCHNPYFVVELQSDVAKIDDLMNVFVPFNDQNNNSNFIFLPLTWAHNLFQNWTKDPKYDSKSSTEEVYKQSKLTGGRKKAVILIVNKPDWFEPQEMTYLGFDNDFSEMPFVESDYIRFDVKQTSNQKYADGTVKETVSRPTANQRLYGQKKLLSFYVTDRNDKFEWHNDHYETMDQKIEVTGTLRFPKKYLVRLKVKRKNILYSSHMKFTDLSNTGSQITTESEEEYQLQQRQLRPLEHEFFIEPSQITSGTDGDYYITFKMKNVCLISAEITNRPYKKIAPYVRFDGAEGGAGGSTYIVTNFRKPIQFTAEPYSSVQIHGDNEISENVGSYVLLDGNKEFSFSGSDNFIDLRDNLKTLANFTTSGGKNFGHNLSVKKLRYTLINAKLTSATLSNQLLRWYAHYKYTNDEINSKGTILNDSGHVGVVLNNTAEQYADPCIQASYNSPPYDSSDGFCFDTSSSQITTAEYTKALNVSTSFSGGNCGSHFGKTCDGCASYDCRVITRCPSGYRPVISNQTVATSGDFNETRRSGKFYYHIKPNRNKMACITCTNGCYVADKNLTDGCRQYVDRNFVKGLVRAYNFHPACYGIRKGKFIMTASNLLSSSVMKGDTQFTIKSNSKHWEGLGVDLKNFIGNENKYRVINFDGGDTTDFVSIFTGRMRYKSSEKYSHFDSYSYATRKYSSHTFTGGGCNSHFGGTCDGCAGYNCELWSSCPGGYEHTPDGQDGFSINWNWNNHKMAWITCVEGCNPTFNNPDKGCRKKEYSYCYKYYNSSGQMTSDECSGKSEVKLSFTGHTNYRYNINNFFFLNGEEKTLKGIVSSFNDANLLRNKGIYSYGDYTTDGEKWLCFCGDGKLDLKFEMKETPSVTISNASGARIKKSFTSQETITIQPDTHLYEKQSNGTYRIRIDFAYANLDELRFVATPCAYVCVSDDLRTPKNSRVVQYRDSNISTYNSPNYSTSINYQKYKSGCCVNPNITNSFNLGNYSGEFFCLTDDIEYGYALNPGLDYLFYSNVSVYEYLGRSLYRCFRNFRDRNISYNSFYWQLNCSLLPLLMTGVTLPINTALYYGSSGTRDHNYAWQSANNGTWNDNYGDATAALKRLTVSAMQKLRNEYGSNLRIYTILYRKQPGDYSYLSGYSYGVYDVNNEKDLQKVLAAVAVDIKSWADYIEAELEEPERKIPDWLEEEDSGDSISDQNSEDSGGAEENSGNAMRGSS